MHWQTIRNQYPQRWLLVEALEAHSEANHRYLDQLAVIDAFDDSRTALQSYSQLHRQAPQRELYVLHTSREQPDITEVRWFGVRETA
jgi:hypothetical protein